MLKFTTFLQGRSAGFRARLLEQGRRRDLPQAYAVWASCPFLDGLDQKQLSAQVPGLTFAVNREVSALAKVGISQLDWAIANTGTLVQDAAPVDQRFVSTLPLIHIALVRGDRLVPDLPVGPEQNTAGAYKLYFLHYRPQPHRRHRTGAHHRRSRARETHHRFLRSLMPESVN